MTILEAMGSRSVDDVAIQAFQESMRGELLRSGDHGYDAARTVWNAMIDRRPALIARCAGSADVIEAVKFAGEHGMLVSVKGGGHGVAGTAVADGGLMIKQLVGGEEYMKPNISEILGMKCECLMFDILDVQIQ